MLGSRTSPRNSGSVVSTHLKVSGVSVFSAGEFLPSEGQDCIVLNDAARGVYKKLVVGQGRLVGAVLVGETQDALWYLDLIRSGAPIAALRNDLMFGRGMADQRRAA